MPSNGDSAYPELLARIRQLEEETARLQLLIAELVLKNQHLRRDIRATPTKTSELVEQRRLNWPAARRL
jgi:ribonuclease D